MRGKNVLIVDDDKIILESLRRFLLQEGFQASGVMTFKRALDKLREQNYCVVIADINLPDGDGFELLELIRKEYPQIVTIAITGYGTIDGDSVLIQGSVPGPKKRLIFMRFATRQKKVYPIDIKYISKESKQGAR